MAEPLPDFLVLGQEDWDEIERRNQLLVRALAARNPQARFLFVELPIRARHLLQARRVRPEPVEDRIFRVRTLRPLPDRIAQLRRVNDMLEARQLRRALRALHMGRPAFWTQDPRAASLVDRLPVSLVVYDLTDDWAAFEHDPHRRTAVAAQIAQLARRADFILACSRSLEAQARGWGCLVEYVPNAVAAQGDPAVEEPQDVAGLAHPRYGYVGTLHDARIDVALLAAAARERPDAAFVLVGPDLLQQQSRDVLTSLPNVHLLGPRPHADVRGYIEAFDVCLLPNLVNEFTRSLDPLKLYEYLAAGKPVVATPTGATAELAEFVALAATGHDLVVAADRALRDDAPRLREARREAVRAATWDARAERIERLLRIADTFGHG